MQPSWRRIAMWCPASLEWLISAAAIPRVSTFLHTADAAGECSTTAAMLLIPTHDSPGLNMASLAESQAFRSGSYTDVPVPADWIRVSRKVPTQSNGPWPKIACWTRASLQPLAHQGFDMLRTKFHELSWDRACTRFGWKISSSIVEQKLCLFVCLFVCL